jgi:type I restriction enzyme M protein
MNLYLHGIDADPPPVRSGVDALAADPGERLSLVLTNPPFGKTSTIAAVNEADDLEKEDAAYEWQDFWTTKNKQFNFLQRVKTLWKVNGRAAVVVPDNVLFAGGAGETVRRNLLRPEGPEEDPLTQPRPGSCPLTSRGRGRGVSGS